MKLLVSVVCGMVAVQIAGVHAQSIESFDPPAFNDNRVTTDLLFMYTFDQDECEAGAFADKRNDTTSLLGDFTYDQGDWGSVEKCPSVNNTGIFENAHHGTTSQGQRVGPSPSPSPLLRTDWIESDSSISSVLADFGSATDFTLEMWIRPSFSSGSGRNQYVLLELGDMMLPTAGNMYNWRCRTDNNFDLRLLYDDNIGSFALEYRHGSGATQCQVIEFAGFALTADTLYHLVVKYFDDSGTQRVTLDVAPVGGSRTTNEQITGNQISFSDFTSGHIVRVGSSPAALSNAASQLLVHSWPGDILLFAMYSDDLTTGQISSNFAAGLPNSVPVPPDSEFVFDGLIGTLVLID